ncbi:MAG: hypothetical protein D8M52_03450 [Chlorobi bacterium]|nr:hypothetical protein [Chlorobiota bacterium]
MGNILTQIIKTLLKGFVMKNVLCLAFVGFAALCCASGLYAQSQTTGTLNLRSTQPATVSLSIPQTGVTGYTVLLPPAVGASGQALTATNVSGNTIELGWTNAEFWHLTGTAITTGGTSSGQQYLGTSNAQDLVLASNATEVIRIIGISGPSQGFVGVGTANPVSLVDVQGTVSLTNSGTASELRIYEPSASGTEYSAFKSGAQSASVTYTLPSAAPTQGGMVLTGDATGSLSWQSALFAILNGLFTPTPGAHIHVIPVGGTITASSVPIVTVINDAGTTIGISVTNRDYVNGNITVETSVGLSATDRIAWAVLNL